MDFDRLRFVAERSRLGEGKEVLLSVVVPDKPRVFYSMMQSVLPRPVTEFSFRSGDPSAARIFMSILVSDRDAEIPAILADFASKGFKGEDISENELAKTHVRYLIGGRPNGVEKWNGEERLYAFEFPERPGALGKFLEMLKPEFNISLFHYRNYGGDIGKVLVGIQIPEGKRGEIDVFLGKLGYPYTDETDNEVFRDFLT